MLESKNCANYLTKFSIDLDKIWLEFGILVSFFRVMNLALFDLIHSVFKGENKTYVIKTTVRWPCIQTLRDLFLSNLI